jgi:hypothetical protein
VYGFITLPLVLYKSETWSLTLKAVRSLRVSENSVQSIIFGLKKDDLEREWIKLHNLELNDLNFRPNIVGIIKSRRMRWAGNVAGMGEEKFLQDVGG